MRTPEPERVGAVVRDVAQTVVMPRFRTLERHEISEKAPGDLVTVADALSEAELTRRLPDLLPGSVVVGEEACAADPLVIGRLSEENPVWVVDPVDGTHNFAHGDPTFALMVALVAGGETRAGWIYLPVEDRMAVAERDGGAWLDGTRMQVAAPERLEDLVGGVSFALFDKSDRGRVHSRCRTFRECRTLRCAGREYLDMSRGVRHFAYYRQLKPWDHAAGVLLHAEAGGYARRASDETPYDLIDPGTGLLVAPSRELWHRILDHLHGG
jgi:fructose-1,6-bisphosphatase/inositol monophosphatase family enzyme